MKADEIHISDSHLHIEDQSSQENFDDSDLIRRNPPQMSNGLYTTNRSCNEVPTTTVVTSHNLLICPQTSPDSITNQHRNSQTCFKKPWTQTKTTETSSSDPIKEPFHAKTWTEKECGHNCTPDSKNRLFTCPTCSKTFSRGDHLKRHLISVHDDVHPYKCGGCKKGFPDVIRITKHVSSGLCLGIEALICCRCQQHFPSCHKLNEHAKMMHVQQDESYMSYLTTICKLYSCRQCNQNSSLRINATKIVRRRKRKSVNNLTMNKPADVKKGINGSSPFINSSASFVEILKSKKSNHVSSSSWNSTSIISFQAPFTDNQTHISTSIQGVNPRTLPASQIRYSSSNLPVIIKKPISESSNRFELDSTINQQSKEHLDPTSTTKSLSNDLSVVSSTCNTPPSIKVSSLSSSLFKRSSLISETIGNALGLLASPEVVESNEDHLYSLPQPLLCSDSLKKLSTIQSESSYQITSESFNRYITPATTTSDHSAVSSLISQSSNTKPQSSTSLQSIVSQSTPSKSKVEGKPSCPVCSLSFENIDSLMVHIENSHLSSNPDFCCICNKRFAQAGNVKRHIRYVHLRYRPHVCKRCNSSFDRACYLHRHLRSHETDANQDPDSVLYIPCNCPICGHNCITAYHMRGHMKRKHLAKNIRNSAQMLAKYRHLLTNEGLRDMGLFILKKNRLASHQNVPQIDSNHKDQVNDVTVDKKKKLGCKEVLLRKKNTIKKRRSVGKMSERSRIYGDLLKSSNSVKLKFRCRKCVSYKFLTLSHLVSHLRIVHGLQKMARLCLLCGNSCRNLQELMGHIERAHKC